MKQLAEMFLRSATLKSYQNARLRLIYILWFLPSRSFASGRKNNSAVRHTGSANIGVRLRKRTEWGGGVSARSETQSCKWELGLDSLLSAGSTQQRKREGTQVY